MPLLVQVSPGVMQQHNNNTIITEEIIYTLSLSSRAAASASLSALHITLYCYCNIGKKYIHLADLLHVFQLL